jgi:glycosyltransferase involved in cell wall biosynthesis
MKILVISHEYPPIGGGGSQVVQDICTHLAARGHQIYVITAHYAGLPELEEKDNLTIDRIHSGRTQPYRASFKTMACFIFKSIGHGLKVIRRQQPDLIHAHFAVPAGAAAFILSRITKKPYMITIHGGDVPGGAPQKTDKWFRFVFPFTRLIWKNATRIISVSQQTRRFALQHYPVEIQVIPNGIDTATCQPGDFQPDLPPRLIYIGRFSPEKNAIAVPEILAQLKDLDWNCVMLGDGPQMDQVRASIAENNLQERIRLAGWVTPQEVNQALAKSDILLMPSLLDSMPMAGLQALAMGLALVLSDIGSCPDYIDHGKNGYLVQPGDLQGYASALRELIMDKKKLQRARAASRSHSRNFDLNQAINDYEKIAAEVIQE